MSSPVPSPPQPDFSVAGRVVLVTGAGAGIGLALARGFARAGASVACFDIDDARARGAAAACGAKCLALTGDVAAEARRRLEAVLNALPA